MKTLMVLTLSLALLLGTVFLLTHAALRAELLSWLPEDAPTGIVLFLVVLLISRPSDDTRAKVQTS